MDNFLGRNPRYESVATAQNTDYELYNTEYHSPDPIYSTPEPYQGFEKKDSRQPLRGLSGSSEDSQTRSIVHKLRSRLSSLKDSELVGKIGKAKGSPHTFKAWFLFWAGIFISLLWCAPAVTLLVLNGTNHIVGASAWCPTGDCPGIPIGTNQSLTELLSKADRDTHDFVGALQFVAKAMEVWFVYIAVTLVYIVTSLLARSEHGLPIGYLLTYMEFTDVLSILKPAHWTSAQLVDNPDPYKEARRVRKFYIFAFGVALLCAVTNLIGPSVAVLMIPTVQSVQTVATYPQRFSTMLSAASPQGPDAIPYCTADDVAKENWACTSSVYDFSLDSMVDYFYSQIQQDYQAGNLTNYVAPPTQEKALSFQFNVTSINTKEAGVYSMWAPNRQTIRLLSQDQEDYFNTVNDPNSPYQGFGNSITLAMQRQGPIIGLQQALWWGNITTTTVASDKEIHCYHSWWQDGDQIYAKCFRAGMGWNSSSAISQFKTGTDGTGYKAPEGMVQVVTTSFFSDAAAFVPTDWSTGNLKAPPCFPNGTLPAGSSCDYDGIFSAPLPAHLPQNMSQHTNAFLVESALVNDTSIGFVYESYLDVGFTTYAVDVTNSSYSSSFGVAQINDLPDVSQTTPLVMNSSWYLVSWSVNNTYDVSSLRFSAQALQDSIFNMYDEYQRNGTIDWEGVYVLTWSQLGTYAVLQAASLLPYSYTNPGTDGLSDDDLHPQFAKNSVRQVYTFGINSRTSTLGIIVTSIGILVAISRAVVGIWARIRHREPVELLVAAMKHDHKAEFEGCGMNERKMAKVRFGIHDDMNEKFIFTKK